MHQMSCRQGLARVFLISSLAALASMPAQAGKKTVVTYDSFEKAGGYTIVDYATKWSNPYGLGEMASAGGDTRNFANGRFNISAAPFLTAYDYSVYDHLKYMAASNQSFAVPARGSITFSSVIEAQTPGTQPGRVIEGTYVQSGQPYAAATMQGQQAAAVMNMIDFTTGQLFDWFIAGNTAFTLIERLPSSVTGSTLPAGRNEMYTQVIREVPIKPGPHTVAITYTRRMNGASVAFYLDGKLISTVKNIGVPLDAQHHKFTGTYPSLGPGALLADQINSFTIGHGLFSLLDAFPFQHPDVPELSVSIPVANRIFGQGVVASFDSFQVTTDEKMPGEPDDPEIVLADH